MCFTLSDNIFFKITPDLAQNATNLLATFIPLSTTAGNSSAIKWYVNDLNDSSLIYPSF